MDPSEYYDYEDRRYLSPTTSRDEQLGFVNTLRDTVGSNTAQINAQTQALGSDLPSSQGGLTGSNSYFAQRYQTSPVEAQVNTLKATAQAKALNDLMTNYQSQAQNRYNQAYRNYTKRNSGGTGTGTTTTTTAADDLFEKNAFDENSNYTAKGSGSYDPNGTGSGTYIPSDNGYAYVRDPAGNITATDDPNYAKASDNYYYDISRITTPIWAEVFGPTLAGTGVTYEQWLSQWKADQASGKKRTKKSAGGGGGGEGF